MIHNPLIKILLLLLFSVSFNSKLSAAQLFPVQVEGVNDKLCFIGEVKGRSYVKIELHPIKSSGEFVSDDNELLKYQGTYYESASARKYVLTAVFSADDRSWTFRCFNSSNHQVFIFKGKQKQDGDIEGTWHSKFKSYAFYLRPQ